MSIQRLEMINFGAGSFNDINHNLIGDEPNASTGKREGEMKLLPESFYPSDRNVICGRGRRIFEHPGNQHFRSIVIPGRVEEYFNAKTKLEKSDIIYDVVSQVRASRPHGGFVKFSGDDGRWYEAGEILSRTKTSQAFRDALLDMYKSSNENKKHRRLAPTSLDMFPSAPPLKRPRVVSEEDPKQQGTAELLPQKDASTPTPTKPHGPACHADLPSWATQSLHDFDWDNLAPGQEQWTCVRDGTPETFAVDKKMFMDQQSELEKTSITELLTVLAILKETRYKLV
jgi:hypothetical protein